MRTRFLRRLVLPAVAVALAVCSSATAPERCSAPSFELAGSVCVDMDRAGRLESRADLIRQEIQRTLSAVNAIMPIADLRIEIIDDPASVIPEVGLGGFAVSGTEIRIWGDPGRANIEDILRADLFPLLAHEIHHARRFRSVGYGSTLLEASISEGLADHFSIEVAGIDPPPWSVALDEAQLAAWTPQVTSSSGPYDHSDWFFGTSQNIPRWTGYAVGFDLVGQHLAANPGTTASSLVDTPAAAFLP